MKIPADMGLKKQAGFTLIELALVLVIGGVLMGTLASTLMIYIKKNQMKVTQQRLDAIDDGLQEYLSLNGELPCVASAAAVPDSATFGMQSADCSAATDPNAVITGSVPIRTINLPDDYSLDAWGNRFTYAVTAFLATDGKYDRTQGKIGIIDANGNSVIGTPNSAHYVIVSHGPDSLGATTMDGLNTGSCDTGALDGENCNGDSVFRRTLISGRGTTAAHYDDFLKFRAMSAFGEAMAPGAVVPFNLSACPPGWTVFPDVAGRFVIGAGDYNGNYSAPGRNGWSFNHTYKVGDPPEGYSHWRAAPVDIGAALNVATSAPPAGGVLPFIYSLNPTPEPEDNRPPYFVLLYCQKT